LPTPIDRLRVQELMGEGAQLVEVLPAREFDDEHLPGAIDLPLRRLENEANEVLDPSRPVIVYCFDSA
jgi:rhodanese-related sulfurtransferase